ncbi:MAG: S1C family serine protease [Clostridia bacterium]|nr:S1C family serine protease [Clostridia bacterium]
MKKRQLFIISTVLVIVLVCVFLVACDGKAGKSAYELAVEQGFEGSLDEWLESLKGDNGVDGTDGVDGRDGTDGITDITQLYDKAVQDGFEGSYLDFLNSYLTLNADTQVAANLALLSAIKVYVSDYYINYWGKKTEVSAVGSGVIYKLNKEAGNAYIITNYHVVYNGNLSNDNKIYSDIKVFLYGYESESQAITAKYIGGAYDYDIAILQVEDSEIIKNSNARAVDVASSKDIVAGSTCFAVGNPATGSSASYSDIKISVTQGVVSVDSENVSVGDSATGYTVSTRVIRVDAAINSGNSGGGLYNSKGQLIGIVNAKATSTSIENMGYAIPSDVVAGIADYAIANCDGEENRYIKKLYLGISGVINSSKSVYDSSSNTVKLVEEIAVGEVEADSIASGKLQEGDILNAVEFDGNKYAITRSFSLPDSLWMAKSGETTTLKFYITRGGEDMTVEIAVTKDNFAQLK